MTGTKLMALSRNAQPGPDDRDEDARDRRADDASRVEQQRVECDRVGEVRAADQLGDVALAGRHLEGVGHAQDRG